MVEVKDYKDLNSEEVQASLDDKVKKLINEVNELNDVDDSNDQLEWVMDKTTELSEEKSSEHIAGVQLNKELKNALLSEDSSVVEVLINELKKFQDKEWVSDLIKNLTEVLYEKSWKAQSGIEQKKSDDLNIGISVGWWKRNEKPFESGTEISTPEPTEPEPTPGPEPEPEPELQSQSVPGGSDDLNIGISVGWWKRNEKPFESGTEISTPEPTEPEPTPGPEPEPEPELQSQSVPGGSDDLNIGISVGWWKRNENPNETLKGNLEPEPEPYPESWDSNPDHWDNNPDHWDNNQELWDVDFGRYWPWEVSWPNDNEWGNAWESDGESGGGE